MSENSGEQFQITKHYLECRSVENARYPTLLACIFLLTYIVLPVVLAPEQIFFADFITCLAISLYALGYLSITAYASPSFLILPKRKNRARKSLVTLAAFEAMLLLGCSGVWLLIGMAVNKDPNWHYLYFLATIVHLGGRRDGFGNDRFSSISDINSLFCQYLECL